jgi:hypothetical protein
MRREKMSSGGGDMEWGLRSGAKKQALACCNADMGTHSVGRWQAGRRGRRADEGRVGIRVDYCRYASPVISSKVIFSQRYILNDIRIINCISIVLSFTDGTKKGCLKNST